MGDRAVVVFWDEDTVRQKSVSAVYLHWGGQNVPEHLKKTRTLMANVLGDSLYAAARFCGIVHEATPGNMSLGLLSFDRARLCSHPEEYSHGDSGLWMIRCSLEVWQARVYRTYRDWGHPFEETDRVELLSVT